MCCAIPYPCIGVMVSVLRISMSSVPGSTSARSVLLDMMDMVESDWLQHRVPRLNRDDVPVQQIDCSLGVPGMTRIVGHHADRRAGAMQLGQELHHLIAVIAIEITGGLIRENDQWLACNRARNSDALLLTAGELCRVVIQPVRHPHALEGVERALAPVSRFQTAVTQR